MRIVLVDIGISNIASVAQAFRRVGAPIELSADPARIAAAHAIVLPGVGAFSDGIASLRAKGLVEPLRVAAKGGTPFLGFCLGLQLMALQSEEMGRHEGLGLINAHVVRLQPSSAAERVPNMGWCDVRAAQGSILFRGIAQDASLYFAHSYHVQCTRAADVAATLAFGGCRIAAAVEAGAVFGLQAHPEKSQDAGLSVLANFVEYVRTRSRKAAS